MLDDINNENLDQDLQDALSGIVKGFDREGDYIYKQQLKVYRKHEEFWHGIQQLFWSEDIGDWRSPSTSSIAEFEAELGENYPLYDYVINIFKAHGESIIGAVTARLPYVHFPPDDADSVEDMTTSKAFSNIAELIQKHNRARLLFIRMWFLLYTQGLVCVYNYHKADEKFGTHFIPKFEEQEISQDSYFCVDCGERIIDQSAPCPACGSEVKPRVEKSAPIKVPVKTGVEELPKSRELLDAFGPTNARLPHYARNQADIGYLFLYMEQHFALLRHIFPHIADKIGPATGPADSYGRWARTPTTYASASKGLDSSYLITTRRCWLRPWTFQRLGSDDINERRKKRLLQLFPKGVLVTYVGDVYAGARAEDLDSVWTIGQDSAASYLHTDPLGQPMIPVQEMRNTLTNLKIQSVEYGIPETFADPEVLNFDEYNEHEASPGFIYPASKEPGHSLGEGFHTLPKAVFPREVNTMEAKLDQDAQFLVGSFPSIYGGPSEGKSRTFSEYQMSRAMALQRLQNPWEMMSDLWARVMDKAVRSYANHMLEDERFTKKENDSYVNVWIRKAELTGKVGEVEPEAAEDLPISSGQKRDMLIRLIEMNNDYVNAALYHPENSKNISNALSFVDFYIPGEDQRLKQRLEIKSLLQKEPESDGVPSVQVEPEIDDDAVHIQVLKAFLASQTGIQIKSENPAGYMNCIYHLRLHIQSLEQKTQGQNEATAPGERPESSAPSTST